MAEGVLTVEPVVPARGCNGRLELAELHPTPNRGRIDRNQLRELSSRDIHVSACHARHHATAKRALQARHAVFYTFRLILRDLRGYAYDEPMSTTGLVPNWIPDTSTFGARLALVRWRMGWNLREAERECNITQNLWGGWEDGKEPRNFIEIVNRIVLRTGVEKVWLMTGQGSPEPQRPVNDVKSIGINGITKPDATITNLNQWRATKQAG